MAALQVNTLSADQRSNIISTLHAMEAQCMAMPNPTGRVTETQRIINNALNAQRPVDYLRRLAENDPNAKQVCREVGIPV